MKLKHVSFICILFSLIFFNSQVTLTQTKEKPDYSEALRFIDIWMDAQRDYDRLPGISAAIVCDQEILWSKGYGFSDIKKEVHATPNTIYSICSISKLFTSVAIMKLRDQGKLSLEDQVVDLLPWFNIKQQWEKSGPITIRSLLTHSSGLPRESDYPYWTGPDFRFPTQKEVKDQLGKQETLYPASTYFQYSNLGLTLLGEIVAHISGMPFEEYVYQNIINPLRLADTHTDLPKALWGGKLSTGYSAIKRNGTRDMIPLFNARGIAAAAGFSSTVQDLARFASWQFRLLELGGEEIIKASTLREMQRVQWLDPDWKTSWGLGFSVYKVDEKTMVGHGGSCPGYRSTLMIDPHKKQAFIVMINAQGVNPNKYATGMREILKKAEEVKKGKKSKNLNLEKFAGLYKSQPWGGETAVLPWKGSLVVFFLPSDNPLKYFIQLKHIKGNVFRRIRKDDTLGEKVVFEEDKSGIVLRFWRHSNYSNKIK